MNKKFLSAILFGALMVTSTGTFVSCKDYDEDIDSINKELTDIKSQLAALQTKVDAGKWITGVTTTANGVAITMSDGQTLNITNGKDGQNGAAGAQGEAGKDGKDGSVVEVKDGVLCINGVATEIKVAKEAPAALPCVKVEDGKLMVLGADGKYAATGIEAGAVTAAKTNGVWTITVDGQEIVVPGSAALTSIAIENGTDFKYYYAAVKEAVKWGWNKEETMPAGFYSKLNTNLEVLLNPAEADGTAFSYTFKNSKGEAADVTFFGEARPSTAVLHASRATSANGLWTLPAAVTAKPAEEIETLRRELYLNFKENDKAAYAMTLEAADGLGNTAVRSGYDYKIDLAKAINSVSVAEADKHMYCLVNQEYYPTIEGDAYDYKIRLKQDAENLRWAKVFGIKVTEDEKGFIAENESAVYNDIDFEVAYVTIGGKPDKTSFKVSFTNEMAVSEAMQVEALNAPFDATLVAKTNKVFAMSYKYDLSEQVAKLSDDAKLLWDQALDNEESFEVELIGGEVNGEGENYNALNRNKQLLKNIEWSINPRTSAKDANVFNATFKVSNTWIEPADYAEKMDWVAYSNFQLNTAYQLNIKVKDPLNEGIVVAEIAFPFELTQPTLDIDQVPGEFTEWDYITLLRTDADGNYYNSDERALLVYGVKGESNQNMYMPLYDSFTAWKAKGTAGVTANFQKYVDNAEYYNLSFKGTAGMRILSDDVQAAGTAFTYPLDNNLDYSARFQNLNTWALYADVNAAATNTTVENYWNSTTKELEAKPYELSTPIEVCYKHYGVYEAFDHSKFEDGKINEADFHLVFASWLKHSSLKMTAENYNTERGTHALFISNEDLNFTTPKGDAFYLFDGISANGKVVERADLNGAFNEVQQHPFTTVDELFVAANFKAKEADGQQVELTVDYKGEPENPCTMDVETGELTLDYTKFPSGENKVRIYRVDSYAKVANAESATGVQQAFQGGMVVVLPKSIQDGQGVILTVTLSDAYGYTNSFDIEIEKLN